MMRELFHGLWLCTVLFLIGCLSSCAVMKDYAVVTAAKYEPYHAEPLAKQVPADELVQDVDYLVQTLEAVHPSPYSIMLRDSFEKEVEAVKQRVAGGLTRREFFLVLAPLLVKLEHDHTHVQFPWDAYNHYLDAGGKRFPLEIAVIDGQLIVKENYSAENIPAGSRIQSINGITADDLTNRFLEYCYGGTLYTRIQKRMVNEFAPLLWLLYGFGDQFVLEIDGQTIVVSGSARSEIEKAKSSSPTAATDQREIAYLALDNRIGVLTVPDFHQSDCKAKLREAFSTINHDDIQDLIVDVRNNTGGNTIQVRMLLDYLFDGPYRTNAYIEQKRSQQFDEFLNELFNWWAKPLRRFHPLMRQYYATPRGEVVRVAMNEGRPKRTPLRFHGAVYVLIGPNNYSSGTEFATVLKDFHAGVLVGQDTGGSPNEYGNPYEFVLPHSHLGVRCATNYSVRPSGDIAAGPLKPDIEVVPTIETLDARTDTVLAVTLSTIEERRHDRKE